MAHFKGLRGFRSEITVFLSLLLSGLFAFLLALTESLRFQGAALQAELSMEEALFSCFGEYSQKLFERYELLYIDTGYRTEAGDLNRVRDHLTEYLTENLKEDRLYGLSCEDMKITQYMLANDGEGGAMMNQAIAYMKEYGENRFLSAMEENFVDYFSVPDEDRFFRVFDELSGSLRESGLTEYPVEYIRELRDSEEYLLLQGTSGMFYSVGDTDVPSKRGLNEGAYPPEKCVPLEGRPAHEVFTEYLLQKLGCYTESVGEQALSCELEYLINGALSDRENLKAVTGKLLSAREEVNLCVILNSPDMLYEAEELAARYCNGAPEEKAVLSEAIIYAWAYAEALIEVNRLLCGGRCDPSPVRSSFILPLDEMSRVSDYLGAGGGSGFSYKEYLGFLIRETNAGNRVNIRKRFMDIVELDMRKSENESFRIDGCVEYIEAECRLLSDYGFHRSIRRSFAY
ncbi:MAG: DUF5702 domain-containing protein [Lachnospiraceae bacterium]|nr:DUF5702 domain-containing protein [Lachnospiraceae bacterium]